MQSPLPGASGGRGALVPWLLAAPVILLYMVCLVLPLAVLLVTSFTTFDPRGGGPTEFTVANYAKALGDSFYLGVLFRTMWLAFLVTLVTLVVGYPVAYYVRLSSGRAQAYLLLLIIAPLMVSLIVRAFGWVVVFGSRGVLNFLLLRAGVIETPLRLMYTEFAVIVGMAHVYFPFMVLALLSSLQNIDPTLRLAANNLGAGRVRTFWRITLPLSLPGVLAGSMIVFCLSASAFVTPTVLGGPRVKVMAYMVWEQFLLILNWPLGAAIGFVLLVITTGLMLVYNRLLERGRFGIVFQ